MMDLRLSRWPALIVVAACAAGGTAVASAGQPPPRCTADQLGIGLHPVAGGLGHQAVVVGFRDRGPVCRLGGYPGVDGLSGTRVRTFVASRTRAGYLGGLGERERIPTVTLRPGQVAGAMVEWDDGPTGCPYAQYLRVTPPGDRGSAVVRESSRPVRTCAPEVHPVVPGETGRLPAPR